MSLETDLLLDRRRLKRRLVFWRVFAILAVVAAVLIGLRGIGIGITPTGPHVARVTINGVITADRKLVDAIDALATDSQVKAVIVSINSPGGSVSGGENLHDAIARVAAKKPVVVTMQGLAASAGYMIAVPANRIFAHQSTLTGSIGVLLEAPEFSGLLAKLGIDPEVIRSGPLKDEPSLTHPLSEAGRQVMQGVVNDMYDQFVTMVATGRHMDPAKVRALADGRVYTGRQALANGLIDAIGDEHDARAWLAATEHVPSDLPVTDVEEGGFAERALTGELAPLLLRSSLSLYKALISQSLNLDGPLALWQRSGN